MTLYKENYTLGKGNIQTFWVLLDTDSELVLIPGDLLPQIKHCEPPVKVGAYGVINVVLTEV